MTDKERYEELIATIKNLIVEFEDENKYQPDKKYYPRDILPILDSLAEYQE